jgi:hypothetical protein
MKDVKLEIGENLFMVLFFAGILIATTLHC